MQSLYDNISYGLTDKEPSAQDVRNKYDSLIGLSYNSASKVVTGEHVTGEFKARWLDNSGTYISRIISFKDGATKTRIPADSPQIVSSQSLIKLANGKELSEEELEESPYLKKWDSKQASEYLNHLAKIRYGLFKESEEVKEAN